MNRYNAAVIGCGRIGTFFDSPQSKKVLTHAHAYFSHPKTNLVAVMDTDASRAQKAAELWHCDPYDNLQKLLHDKKPDIVSISVPDDCHYGCLKDVFSFKPKVVITEKPLTDELSKSEEIVNEYKAAQIPLIVNYTRRFDKTVQQLKSEIECGKYGEIQNVTVRYTKGILHNGSHAVDICNYLFGDIVSQDVLSAIIDYCVSDPTLTCRLTYQACKDVFLIGYDENSFSVFELDIVGKCGRICFEDFGLVCTEYTVKDDPDYVKYRELRKAEPRNTGLDYAFLNMVDNAVNHIENAQPVICSAHDALKAQRICDSLMKRYNETIADAGIS